MDTILETNHAIEAVRTEAAGNNGRPRPEWIRGTCPECGDPLVSNCYSVGGRGYLIAWDCWASMKPNPTYTYRRAL